jgi:hypothetical protein
MKPVLKAPRTNRLKLKYDKLLYNVAFKFSLRRYNPDNRTRFYKLELRAKSMERVLHNQRMTRHLGRHMDEAGRMVGQSFEAAANKGITYEEQTRYGLPDITGHLIQCVVKPRLLSEMLGWRFGIRTDSVEGRIRADSGGFRAAPQGISLRYFTFCMGILSLQKWVPDSDVFGRESDSDGFQAKYGSRQPM